MIFGPRRKQGWLAAFAVLVLAGCDQSTEPWGPAAKTDSPPGNTTPELTVRGVEWSWNHKDIAAYRMLFSDDYRFAFSTLDPAGDAYRGDLWNRADELISATHLFVGGSPTEPPATSISLQFASNLIVSPDPRPGKDSESHKLISTPFTLTVVTPDKEMSITGIATFYLARGDVTVIPDDLKAMGLGPDATKWYIERWEDDSASGPGGVAQAMPTKNFTLGQLKVIYR